MKRLFIISVLTLAVLAGCERKEPGDPSSRTADADNTVSGELLLYCGAGIRPPAEDLIEAFEAKYGAKVNPDYAGSEMLLSKIKVSQRGDLYMPGDALYMQQADSLGMILSHRPVCYWIPTILVQKGNPKAVNTVEDLLKPGLKVGLGDPNVCAIGKITWRVLNKNGITPQALEENLKFQSLTVNELGMQIQAKALDAVIVWDAMASYYADYGDAVAIPAEKNAISAVEVGVLKFTKNRTLAEKFVEFLTSDEGRAIFAKHNYSTQSP